MTYYCQFLLSTLRDAPVPVYETCGAELRWDGEHGLSCPVHGPRHLAERLAPIRPGSLVLGASDVCTVTKC